MKKCAFIILSAFSLISCFKSDNRDLGPDYSVNGYLQYELNGFPYEYVGGSADIASRGIGVYAIKQLKSGSVPATKYTITGQIGVGKKVNIVIITDSLKTGTYTTATSSNALTFVKTDSIQYSANRPEDVLTVTISKNTAGVIEGTVSGKLSAATTTGGSTTYTDGLITNGAFKNIVIQYP